MQRKTCLLGAITAAVLLFQNAYACNILLTNDDGWAAALVRAQRDSLVGAGYDVRSRLPTFLPRS